MAQNLYRLMTAFENHDSVKTYATFQTLVTIFEQQCEITDDLIITKKKSVTETPMFLTILTKQIRPAVQITQLNIL